MDIKKTSHENLSFKFSVNISAKEIDDAVDSEISTQAHDISIPGFRPGKAPISILRQKFRPRILGNVLQNLVDTAYKKALSDNDIRPAGDPHLDIEPYEGEGDLNFTMSVDCLPDIELKDFSTLKSTKYNITIEDEIVDKQLKSIAQSYRQTEEVDRKAKDGDIAVIDFVGSVDGIEFEGGKADNQPVEIGEGRFIPGFEEQLIGVKKGDKTTINVTFPDEYGAENLAGKDAVFVINVREIRQVNARKIDDEFAKELGYENEAALRDAVIAQARQTYDEHAKQFIKNELLDQLDAQYDFDMPTNMIEREVESVAHEETDHDPNHGADHKHEMSDEQRVEFTKKATKRVKLGLLLAEIGRERNVEVSEQEINQALMQVAQNYPGQQQQVIEYYKNNRQALFALQAPIFENKVIDAIMNDVALAEQDISLDDFNAILTAQQAGEDTSTSKKSDAKKSKKAKSAKKEASKKAPKKAAKKSSKKTSSKKS